MVFVIAVTLLDMVTLMLAALLLQRPDPEPGRPALSRTMRVATLLKHVSMLDVCLTGIVLVLLSIAIYEKQGIHLRIMSGFWYLLAAEVVHYATYALVKSTAE